MNINFMRKRIVRVLIVWVAISGASATAQQFTSFDYNIRDLLVAMKGSPRAATQLAILFRVGDDRVADLIRTLGDPNEEVRFSAQLVLRYLGNHDGMNAWDKAYESNTDGMMSAPLPIPLREWDYEFIRSFYLRERITTEELMEAYLFALALDGSPRARQVLSEVIANASRSGFDLEESRYLQVREIKFPSKGDLANAVLHGAGFIDPADRKYTTAKLIGFSGAKDKALIEIYIGRGPLAEEWYHVVVRKGEQGWEFFSITKIARS